MWTPRRERLDTTMLTGWLSSRLKGRRLETLPLGILSEIKAIRTSMVKARIFTP
jgi:hypothetical protein